MESNGYHSSNSENEDSSYSSTEEIKKPKKTKQVKPLSSFNDLSNPPKKSLKRKNKEDNDGTCTKKSKNIKKEPKSDTEKKSTKEKKREPKSEKEVKKEKLKDDSTKGHKSPKTTKNKVSFLTLTNEEYTISNNTLMFNKRMEFKIGQCIEIPINHLTQLDIVFLREDDKPLDFFAQFARGNDNSNYVFLHVLQNFNSSIGQKICIPMRNK